MSSAAYFAVVEFAWHGDVARAVALALLFDEELAADVIDEPLIDICGRAIYELEHNVTETHVKSLRLIEERGHVPAIWKAPTADMIVNFKSM